MTRSPDKRPPTGRWSSYAIAPAVLLLLGGHIAATLVYLSPPNIAKQHFGTAAEEYITPLFRQRWHLFSPNPGISSQKMAIRCGDREGSWSPWFDPLEGLTMDHYDNRISGNGKLLYLYRALGNDLRRDMKHRMLECQEDRYEKAEEEGREPPDRIVDDAGAEIHPCSPEALMDDLVATEQFTMAARYADQVCEAYMADGDVGRVQFKLLEFFPVEYGKRDKADAEGVNWGKVHEVVFPFVERSLAR